jgi:hypothetical protein
VEGKNLQEELPTILNFMMRNKITKTQIIVSLQSINSTDKENSKKIFKQQALD